MAIIIKYYHHCHRFHHHRRNQTIRAHSKQMFQYAERWSVVSIGTNHLMQTSSTVGYTTRAQCEDAGDQWLSPL